MANGAAGFSGNGKSGLADCGAVTCGTGGAACQNGAGFLSIGNANCLSGVTMVMLQ